MGLSTLLTAAFNSRMDTRTPLWINLFGLGALVLGGWAAGNRYGLPGMAAALVLSYALVLALQALLLRHRHRLPIPGMLFNAQSVKITAFALAIPSAIAGAAFGAVRGQALPVWVGVLLAGLSAAGVLGGVIALTAEYRSAGTQLLKRKSS